MDSRTFRSLCREFDNQSEAPIDVRWSHCEQDDRTCPAVPNVSDWFVVIAENCKGEYVVRRASVQRDRAEVYSPNDHIVTIGGARCYTSDIERAREVATDTF